MLEILAWIAGIAAGLAVLGLVVVGVLAIYVLNGLGDFARRR